MTHATSQRTWGLVVTVAGVVIAGAAAGFLVWNAGQKSDAQSALDAASTQLTSMQGICAVRTALGDSAQCNQGVLDAQSTLSSDKGRDAFGYVGLGVGAAAAGFGLYLFFSSDDPHRYDRSRPSTEARAQALRPLVLGDARGGVAGVSGAF